MNPTYNPSLNPFSNYKPGSLSGYSPTASPSAPAQTPFQSSASGLFGSALNRIGSGLSGFYNGLTGGTPTANAMGTPAKSPVNNITPPSNSISPALAAPKAPSGTMIPALGSAGYTPGASYNGTTGAVTQPAVQSAPAVSPSGYYGGLFGSTAGNLAATQPSGATQNAIAASQNIANQAPTPNSNASQNQQTAASAQGLLGQFAQNQTPAVTQAYNNLAAFEKVNPLLASTVQAIPVAADIARGQGAIIGNQLAGTQQGLASAYNAAVQGQAQQIGAAGEQGQQALTGQGQQITAAGQAGQLANTAQANQITGQTNAANLPGVAPTLGQYGQTYYQFGNPQATGSVGGVTGPAAAGVVQGQANAGQTFAQNNAILGKVQAQLPALSQLINSSGYNSNPFTFANQIQQWASGTLSNSTIPEVQGSLNDIVASLSQVLGVPSSGASDFRTQFAAQIVNGLQSGQSIQQALQFAVNQATQGNQGYLQGATGQGQSSNGTINAGGYNFVQQNGKWVPAQ